MSKFGSPFMAKSPLSELKKDWKKSSKPPVVPIPEPKQRRRGDETYKN